MKRRKLEKMMQLHAHDEGRLTEVIENQTSKLPSGVYLTAALAAMAASLTFQCIRKNKTSQFVGQWAAPLLIMGLYNKVVKTMGHD